MNKNNLLLSTVAVLALALTAGCSTAVRSVTHGLWNDSKDHHSLALSYWEGSCRSKLFFGGGCSRGESHVKFCQAQPDNELKCENLSELDTLLNN